jgi:hypothetical protein
MLIGRTAARCRRVAKSRRLVWGSTSTPDLELISVTVDPFNRAMVVLTVRSTDDTVFAVLRD